ncbi:hypothetical protein JTE90_018328 [Oedothorax gibbosus]|uniref:Uncharacterized protein n=1 Tax=Oedothorax gibbosus TaxID=931172 RepID=A0AAV6THL9_9ARAC|nr:hypothetical protein JTE90_018328 [Oedothorax gibbosus]
MGEKSALHTKGPDGRLRVPRGPLLVSKRALGDNQTPGFKGVRCETLIAPMKGVVALTVDEAREVGFLRSV